jgi:hypothetical protein
MQDLEERATNLLEIAKTNGLVVHTPSTSFEPDELNANELRGELRELLSKKGRFQAVRTFLGMDVLQLAGMSEDDPDFDALSDILNDRIDNVYEAPAGDKGDGIAILFWFDEG